MKSRKYPLFIWLIFCGMLAYSQGYIRDVTPFSVFVDNNEIESPFTGGLNQPDPRFIDWNEDGILDCFVNDRDGYLQYWKGLPMVIPDSGAYIPQFELITKAFQNINIGSWFTFHDFDGDGDLDLLSQTFGTVNVSYWVNENGEFELYSDELLDVENRPIYGGQIVIPAIADINHDGLIDYFVGDISGRLSYYQGHTFQDGVPQFEHITDAFEGIQIIWTPGRHGANAIEFFDLDNDNDLDLIWGDFYQPGLFYLNNYGTVDTPDFDQDLLVDNFPSNLDFQTSGFNIPRFADFDGNGVTEMVVGVLSGAYGTDYVDNLYYFHNNGTAENWDFEMITSRLLPGLDFISSSKPVFSGQHCVFGDQPKFWIGNAFNPVNQNWSGELVSLTKDIISDDIYWLNDESVFQLGSNLSPAVLEQSFNQTYHMSTLFIGDFNGTLFEIDEFINDIDYCYFEEPIPDYLNIDLSGRATPAFGDVDQDGDDDLVVGDKHGLIHVYWGRGNSDSTLFDSLSILSVDIGENASPSILKNGHILAGNETGELFEITLNNGELIAELRTDIPYLGRNLSPAVYYKEGQSEPDLIFGTQAGGLQYFRYDTTVTSIIDESLPTRFKLSQPYPNPFNNKVSFSIKLDYPKIIHIDLLNILGQKVQEIYTGQISARQKKWTIEISGSTGIYFLRVQTKEQRLIRKIVLLK